MSDHSARSDAADDTLSVMGQETEPKPGEVLFVSSLRDGNRTTVKLEGELDLHGTALLTAEVRQALSDAAEIVEIDAELLTFADSAGLRAVLMAREEAQRSGVEFRIVRVSAPVGRVIEIAGLSAELLPS